MLKSLSIVNFAVIQRLQMSFHEGLNLLTGETGSGKSIIVDALGLLLGGRSSATQIRTGEDTAVVEGLFELSGKNVSEAQDLLETSNVVDAGSYQLLIRREITTNNKSRIFVNKKSVTISTLRSLQPLLVETHGQGEQRALLSTQSHLELLDQFAGCVPLRQQVSGAYSRWRAAKEALSELERESAEREKASDLLQFQLSELETLAPKPNEDEELYAERKLLTHAETILQLASAAYLELYESDGSVLSRLAVVRRSLEELCKIDGRLTATAESLEEAITSIADIADTLRHYESTLEFSPARLAEIEDRLTELERVKRKYHTDIQGVVKILGELSERLVSFNEIADREPILREALQIAESDYKTLAGQLSHCRSLAKEKLERRVMIDLKQVAMENAQFIVNIISDSFNESDNVEESGSSVTKKGEGKSSSYTPYGMDRVEFLISANPGESPRSLAHVASGGELSRLMLTLRTIGTTGQAERQQDVESLIFDEIDVGIGGRVAEAVGRRLKALAAAKQVLCVTHQPQIARFADHHYLIEKMVVRGRTQTIVKELNTDERVGELARMIGGDEHAQAARETARWLLDHPDKNRGRTSIGKKSSKL